jgi:diguanylate cyclase (GGDEF)-like protein
VYDESPVAILRTRIVDGQVGVIVDANPASAALLGRPVAELVGSDLHGLLAEGGPLRIGAPTGRAALRAGAEQGQVRWISTSVTELSPEAGPGLALVMLHDVTEHVRAEERLNRAARHDPLTGLINRGELVRLLSGGDPVHRGGHVAVIFLDLDGFKLVNDSRGHQVGDELLVAVARRIRAAVRPEDSLARIGGDEFVVVCPALADPQDARVVAERVRATLDEPVSIEGRAHRISMSVGIASAPADRVDASELLRQADMAMYRAKDAGRNTVRFHSADMDEALAASERIREALTAALDGEGAAGAAAPADSRPGLVLHFQPIVEISSGRLTYVEALARVRDAHGALVYPSDFLPVAARAGLNGPLSERVLRLALQQRRRWRAEGIDVPVGLNLTRGQVFSASFAGDALRIVAEEHDTPAGVVFEMGEFGLLEATGPAQLTLRRLRDSGIGLAIDHFGTGYSSLGALRFLGPHRVKIDRSFVASIPASPADRAIVTAAISAAHALGQRVVAEGVETAQQLDVLAGLGCDEAQGFLVAQVLPAERLQLPSTRWSPGTLARNSA